MDNRATLIPAGWFLMCKQEKSFLLNTRNGNYFQGGQRNTTWRLGFRLANIHEDDAGRIVSDFQINLEKETINHLSMIINIQIQKKKKDTSIIKCDQRS